MKCAQGGRCIARGRVCDSVIDCLDADDELNCDGNRSTFLVDDLNLRHANKRVNGKNSNATKSAEKFKSFSMWKNQHESAARHSNADGAPDADEGKENEFDTMTDRFECTL